MRKLTTIINAVLGLCMLCTPCLSRAAEEESDEIEFPDLEMLEFLGQFATDNGDWVDPDSLLSDEFGQLLDAAIENRAAENEIETDNTEDDI